MKSIKDIISQNKKHFTWKKCEACGEYSRENTMESVAVDEERTPALVCPKCYYCCSEKADELEYDICSGEYEPEPKITLERDAREEALNDLSSGKW